MASSPFCSCQNSFCWRVVMVSAGLFAWLHLPASAAQNFSCADAELVQAAEQARCRSALFWTGQLLPGDWSAPCPISAQQANHSGGGRTSFHFDRGEVSGWRMEVTGTREGILKNVIPHEVDHMVRASLIRHPLERWLDEGCALLMESPEMHEFLRGIAGEVDPSIITVSWLESRDYPRDAREINSLYAVGFSLVEYLLTRGSPGRLLEFQHDTACMPIRLQRHYQLTPEQLQTGWSRWRKSRQHADCVSGGCPLHQAAVATTPNSSTGDRIPLTVWTAAWCGPCRQFKQDYASLPEFRAAIDSRFAIQWCDVDQRQAAAPDGPIQGVPMWVLPDRRWTGYAGPEDLLKRLGIGEGSPRSSDPLATEVIPDAAASGDSPEKKSSPAVSGGNKSAPGKKGTPPALPESSSASQGWKILQWVPVTLSALQWLGVIGGSVATGGVGGIALTAAMMVLRGGRLLHSRKGSAVSVPAGSGERSGAAPAAPFPRRLDEAGELLELRQSEGRMATLDTLRGMFLDDELDKLEQGDATSAQLAVSLRKAIDLRVAEVAPLTTEIS